MYWSIRRELWENRSVYIAPLAVAVLLLLGFLISAINLPHSMRAVLALDPALQRAAIEKPYDIAAILTMLTAFIVGVFYCLDALHGERRDRSWFCLCSSSRSSLPRSSSCCWWPPRSCWGTV